MLSDAVVKINNLGKRGFMLAYNCNSYKEGKNTNNDMMKRSKRNVAYWLVPMAWSAGFLIQPWTTLPGVTLPAVSWTLPHQLLILKTPRFLSTDGVVLQ